MFTDSGMSVANLNATLRGWAKLDATAGETAIQNEVTWGIAAYTDATARQYLMDTYGWTINGTIEADIKVGDNYVNDTLDYGTGPEGLVFHGLGGNHQIYGTTGADWIVGGSGDDVLAGRGGVDTFHYGFSDAGNDAIVDFTNGAGGASSTLPTF